MVPVFQIPFQMEEAIVIQRSVFPDDEVSVDDQVLRKLSGFCKFVHPFTKLFRNPINKTP